MELNRSPRMADPDGFFAELVEAQRGMSDAEAQMMLAKLVLVLANQVGDPAVLREAIRLAARRPGADVKAA